jgi:hypothetical protein
MAHQITKKSTAKLSIDIYNQAYMDPQFAAWGKRCTRFKFMQYDNDNDNNKTHAWRLRSAHYFHINTNNRPLSPVAYDAFQCTCTYVLIHIIYHPRFLLSETKTGKP